MSLGRALSISIVLMGIVLLFLVITAAINLITSEEYTLTNVSCGKNSDGSYDPNKNYCNKDILCSEYFKYLNPKECERFLK